MTNKDSMMSFGDHLHELRRRLILVMVGVVPVFFVSLFFGSQILEFLIEPLRVALLKADQPQAMLATNALEPFIAYLKVSFALTLLVGMPWMLIQGWFFIAPGLFLRERRFVYFLVPLSTSLTAIGMVFLYTVLLPISLYFLITFNAALVQRPAQTAPIPEGVTLPVMPVLQGVPTKADFESGLVGPGSWYFNEKTSQVQVVRPNGDVGTISVRGDGLIAQEFRVGEYIGLVFLLAMVFAISSQLPVVMLLLSWVGLLQPGFVSRYRRHVGFACAILGAVLTPQDPISMIAMGGALYLLFEFGILLMRFVPASRIAGEREEDLEPDGDE